MIRYPCCRSPNWQQKGVLYIDNVLTFLVSIMASVVAYFVCKWLDGNENDN